MERKCRHPQGHHQRSPESQDRVLGLGIFTWLTHENSVLNLFPNVTAARRKGILHPYNHHCCNNFAILNCNFNVELPNLTDAIGN